MKQENAILGDHFVWEMVSSTSRSKIINVPATGIFRMLKNTFLSQFTSSTAGKQNVLQSGKG